MEYFLNDPCLDCAGSGYAWTRENIQRRNSDGSDSSYLFKVRNMICLDRYVYYVYSYLLMFGRWNGASGVDFPGIRRVCNY